MGFFFKVAMLIFFKTRVNELQMLNIYLRKHYKLIKMGIISQYGEHVKGYNYFMLY